MDAPWLYEGIFMDEQNIDKYGHWDISLVGDFIPSEWFGFIYFIKNKISGKQYIGKKFFNKKKTTKINGRKKSKRVESDWKYYISSSDSVKDDILKLGKENFLFQIFKLCSGRAEVGYLEEKYQYQYNVLYEKFPNSNEKTFYNKVIGHRHFAGVEKQSKESNIKRSKSLMGHIVSEETRKKGI